MEKIDVKEFKGLYTNLLDNSANYSVFADMDKVKVSKKYLQSEEYQLEDSLGWIGEFGNDIIEVKVIELDDDKFWYEKNLEKYIPDFVKHLVVFTSTTVLVYEIKTEGLVYIDAFSISEYKKSVIVNGILKILTSKSIYFLFYKRINSVKTLKFTSINPTIDSLVASSSTGNVTLKDPKITFDIVATPMIYWLSDTMQGTNIRTSLYKLPSDWDVKDAITNVWFYAYVGTVYLVRPKHNTLNLQTKGLYDFDSLAGNTFAFVPVEILNGTVCLIPTRVNYTEIVKKPVFYNLNGSTYFDARNRVYNPDVTLGFPTEIRVNPETAFFIGADELHIGNFNAKFIFEVLPTNPYVTVASGRTAILQSKFFEWFNNPDYEHKIRGTYTLTVTDLGFEVTSENQQIVGNFIQTVTYIDNEEVIIAKAQVFATSSSTRVIYGLKPIRTFDSAVIQSKIYIGFGIKPSVYELVSSKQIYKGEVFDEINYYGYLDLTGILLSNLLAVYGDIDQFEYVKGGDDYVIVNNVGFLIKGGTVYYSPNDVSNAVFYKNRYIPNVYGDALISIGGMLGVIRYNKDVTLISIQVIENEIYFKVYDTVSFVIKDRDSFLEIPDGVLMSLRDGLYLSTPQERQLLSEPINDIFEEGKVTKLLYDDYNRRIMVQYEDEILGNSIYVFDLINKVWLKFKNLQLRNIAFDGENVITIDGSSFAKVILSNDTEGRVTFHKVSLGNNKLLKRLIGLRIDLDGTLTTFTDSYGHSGSLMQSNEQLERRIEEFYIHLNNQSPTVGLDFTIGFKGKIYSIEILYEVIGEFVSTYDKIYYPPIEETIVVQNNTPAIPNPPTEYFITNLSNKTLWFKPENISGLTWVDEITGREWQTDTWVDIPTVALNGYNVFYSNARALCNTLSSAYTVIGTDNSWSIIGVFKLISGTPIFNYLGNGVTAVMTLATDTGATKMYLRDSGNDELLVTSIDDQNVWCAMSISYNNDTKTLRIRLDDIDESSTNLAYNQVAVNLQWGYKFWLNGSTTSTGIVTPGSIGENGIAEFFITTGIKTDTEIANAISWLKYKYGV